MKGIYYFLEQCAASRIIDAKSNQKVDEVFAPTVTFLTDEIAQKQLKDIPLPLMGNLIFGSLSSMAKVPISPNLTDEEERQAALFC